MEISELDLKKAVFLQLVGFEWFKSPFPYSEFVNKSKYLMNPHQIKNVNKKIEKIEKMTNLKLEQLDILCKNPNQNSYIYQEIPIKEDNGLIKYERVKLSVLDLNMLIYKEIICLIHSYLKEYGIKKLDL